MLLSTLLEILADWRPVFCQARSCRRAVRQALGSLVCLGRRTVSRIIWTNGGAQRSWSAEYFLHSRCRWVAQQLFQPILERALPLCRGPLVGVAVDETRLRKTGRSIRQAFYQRDPMSPPFHVNLMLGLRFLQASLLVGPNRKDGVGARALPIRFQEAPAVKKPRRKASAEEWKRYRRLAQQHSVWQRFVQTMDEVRQALDQAGAASKTLVLAADGSFCNRTVFTAPRDRTHLIARARKDAVLCHRAKPGSRRFYGVTKFTPEQVRQDETIPWQTTKVFYGGKLRQVRYKQVDEVLWQGGARRTPLRLFVVAPTPYRKRRSGRRYYRRPAYLLTTDRTSPAKALLQIYFDRWQIEVNHREEKDSLGVGQAQLWNETAVPKQPALVVAAYSALLLTSLLTFGPQRGSAYLPLPKWRRNAKRPSCLDLITLLRQEMTNNPDLTASFDIQLSHQDLTTAAAA